MGQAEQTSVKAVKPLAATESRTRSIAFVALSIAIIAVSAWVTIPIGPVPFTLQMFAVTFAIIVLTPKQALAAIAGYLALGEEGFQLRQVKAFLLFYPEVVLVTIEYQPHNSPHVIYFVWVIKLHRPALRLRRECAKHQHHCPTGQKRLKRMTLNSDIIHDSSDLDHKDSNFFLVYGL